MEPSVIIDILMPVIVFLVTALVKLIKSDIPGAVLVAVVVPLLSLGAAYIGTLLVPPLAFWPAFFLGLIGTFIREVLKQVGQAMTPST